MSPSSSKTFCCVRKRQGAGKVGGNSALPFLRDRARNKNLLQWPLPAKMPQTNAEKMKCLARRAFAVRKGRRDGSLGGRDLRTSHCIGPSELVSAARPARSGRWRRRPAAIGCDDARSPLRQPRLLSTSDRMFQELHVDGTASDRCQQVLERCSSSVALAAAADLCRSAQLPSAVEHQISDSCSPASTAIGVFNSDIGPAWPRLGCTHRDRGRSSSPVPDPDRPRCSPFLRNFEPLVFRWKSLATPSDHILRDRRTSAAHIP